MLEAENNIEDFPKAFCDKVPEIEGERRIDAILDGSEYLVDCTAFVGETSEVRQALENIVNNWPKGVFDRGRFTVRICVSVKIKEADREYIPSWKARKTNV